MFFFLYMRVMGIFTCGYAVICVSVISVQVGLCKYCQHAMGLSMEISQWLPTNLHINSVMSCLIHE